MTECEDKKEISLEEARKNAAPGTWSDDKGFDKERQEKFEQEFREQATKDREERLKLLNELEQSGKITPQLVRLLRVTTTSTFGPDYSNLVKVKAALQLKDSLEQSEINKGTVAYLGSGNDWHLPVALGARTIDMVDLEFKDNEGILTLLERVRELESDARLDPEKPDQIRFKIDLGKGAEDIVLRTHGVDVKDYSPTAQLTGVFEFAGPSKGYGDGTMPVLPNIAKALSNNAFIANFDFNAAQLRSNSGLGVEKFDDFTLLKVQDKDTFQVASEIAGDKLRGPSLSFLRKAIKDK